MMVNIFGGLGNQMFQYAAGALLASKLGCELQIVNDMHTIYGAQSQYLLRKIFGIEAVVADLQGVKSILGWRGLPQVRRFISRPALRRLASDGMVFEPHFHYWSDFQYLKNVSYLHGYWQSARYFSGNESAVKDMFSFQGDLKPEDLVIAQSMRRQPSVAIHVRRGDYTNAKNSRVYAQADQGYFKRAIDHLRTVVANPQFFIFSDDPAWVRQHLLIDESMALVEHNSGVHSWNDMRLMSLADHNIIANSTFSWWAAWLNANPAKIVVAPKNWFLSADMDSSDVCPPAWIRL